MEASAASSSGHRLSSPASLLVGASFLLAYLVVVGNFVGAYDVVEAVIAEDVAAVVAPA